MISIMIALFTTAGLVGSSWVAIKSRSIEVYLVILVMHFMFVMVAAVVGGKCGADADDLLGEQETDEDQTENAYIIHEQKMSRPERVEMYMSMSKHEVVEYLLNCHDVIAKITPRISIGEQETGRGGECEHLETEEKRLRASCCTDCGAIVEMID